MSRVPALGRSIEVLLLTIAGLTAQVAAVDAVSATVGKGHTTASCPDRVGHWPYGPSQAVAVDGSTAFFSVGTVLRVADVSSPGTPQIVAELALGDVIADMAIVGDLLIAAVSDSGVASVDVSDPGNPTLLDRLAVGDDVKAVAIFDGHAVIGGYLLQVVDLSAPADLTVVGSLDSGIASIRDLDVSGTTAVLADYTAGFHIVSVANPTSPALQATHGDDLDRPLSVAISGSYAYLLESHDDVVVFDISNPLAPAIVNRVDPDGSWQAALAVLSGHLYVGRSSGAELFVYDLADPSAPVELWNGSVCSGVHLAFDGAGATLYAAQDSHGLGIVDVSTPSTPQCLGSTPAERQSRLGAMWDSSALMTLGANRVAVFDLADPGNPVELARTSEINPSDVAVRDGYAYSVSTSWFEVVDLADPANPLVVATVDLGGSAIALTGDLAIVGGSSDGIRVVDVSTPAAPVQLALVDVDYTVSGIAATGPAFYVPERQVGLHVFNLSVPSAPVETGLIDLPGISNNVIAAGGGLLAVGDWMNGIRIYDVSTPLEPVETAFYTGLTRWHDFAFSDGLLLVNGLYTDGGLHVLDLDDPTDPIALGAAPLLSDLPEHLTALGGLALVAEEAAGFEIFDLSSCALGPPTADFSWSPALPWVGATVQFADASSGEVTSWSWQFGDGGTASAPNPTHVYAAAGSYQVRLTVTGSTGSDSVTKTVVVTEEPPETPPIEDAGTFQWVVPAAAHSPGAQGTNWVSDVAVHNPSSQAIAVNLYFMGRGRDNSGITGERIELPGEATVGLHDIVLDLFGSSNTSGAILVGAESTVRVASRTYNDDASGTYGQFIPGLPARDSVGSGRQVFLIQLTRSSVFRTNVGWVNLGSSELDLSIRLVGADGVAIGDHQASVPPYGYGQANDILPINIDDAMAVISTSSPDASFFAYASVVDNHTGDPILILEAESAETLYVPAAAHLAGFAGTDWRTDLEIANRMDTPVECSIDLLRTGYDNSSPRTAVVTVPGHSNLRVGDVLKTLLEYEGSAALRLHTGSSAISVTSSTYNSTDEGTYGQYISGVSTADAILPNRPGVMIQLSESDVTTSGFRTNLGLLNTTAGRVEVLIELHDSNGSPVGSGSTVLEPFEHRQINRIFAQVTSSPITDGVAWVSTSTPGGAVLAYASVVDNRSGDPVFIPARVDVR
jgi:PKD repeat protein